jgi:hypothetical protein
MTGLLALGLVVAIWRATRLLVVDEFPPIKGMRVWTIRTFGQVDGAGALTGGRGPRWGDLAGELTVGVHVVRAAAGVLRGFNHAVAYVWTCPWCMSVWAGAGLVWAADWRLSVPFPWLIVAAGSALSGAMSWIEAEHDQRWELRQRQLDGGPDVRR